MRKYIPAFLLILALLTGCLFGAQAGSLSRSEVYEALQQELRCYLEGDEGMPLEELILQFNELGNYKKSAFFSCYASILHDAEQESYENLLLYTELIRLDEDFCALLLEAELPSVDEVEAYALGRQAEAAKDGPAAIAYYQKSISVLDSLRRLAALRLAGPTATPVPTPVPDVIMARLTGAGDQRVIQVEASGSWTAVSDSWIGLSSSWGGPGRTEVEVRLSKNPSRSSPRSGLVTLTCGSVSCTVTIRQEPNAALYDSDDFRVGNVVEFGRYEQDGWSSNGKEAIRWRVLDRSGSYALLLSEQVLDSRAYIDAASSIQVNWQGCSLRTWLNDAFLQSAFSGEEQNAIRTTRVSTPRNPGYDTDPGPDTYDRVFLLSYQECQRYLGNPVAYPTQYAVNRGVMVRQDMGGLTYWWLRSTHSDGKVSIINTSGRLYGSKTNDRDGGVRPAIWVDLSHAIFN